MFFIRVLILAFYQKMPPVGVKTRQEHTVVFVAPQCTLAHVNCKADSVSRVLKHLVFRLSQNSANVTWGAFGKYFGIPKVGLTARE